MLKLFSEEYPVLNMDRIKEVFLLTTIITRRPVLSLLCFKNIKEDVIKEATADLVKVMAGEEMPIKEKYNKLYDFVGIQDLYKNNKEKDIDLIIESFNKNAENYIKLESDGGIENDTPLIARKGEIGIFGISVKNMGVFKVIAACVFFGLFFIVVIFFLLKMNKTKKKGKNKKNK